MRHSTRGILRPGDIGSKFELLRFAPSEDVACFVETYWYTRWDLEGQPPYSAEVLSFPCVHVVFERGHSGVFGVVSARFVRELRGRGQAFGVKFRPGGFYPFVHQPVAALTDGLLPLASVFGRDVEDLVLAQPTARRMVPVVERVFRAALPAVDPFVELIDAVIARIASDRGLTRVEQVGDEFMMSPRMLQRLFKQYVGVTPKWVIKRFRLQEAAERLAADDHVDVAQLAAELGYFDQAHFAKDFKAMVGHSPGQYRQQGAASKAAPQA